jgi:hypothetical protein
MLYYNQLKREPPTRGRQDKNPAAFGQDEPDARELEHANPKPACEWANLLPNRNLGSRCRSAPSKRVVMMVPPRHNETRMSPKRVTGANRSRRPLRHRWRPSGLKPHAARESPGRLDAPTSRATRPAGALRDNRLQPRRAGSWACRTPDGVRIA